MRERDVDFKCNAFLCWDDNNRLWILECTDRLDNRQA